MIREVYQLLQPQAGEEAGFHEVQHGLRSALIHISKDDWLHMTDGLLRPGKETLSEEAFEQLMLRQLQLFAANEAIELMNYTSVAKPGESGLPPIELQTALKMLATAGADDGKEGKTAGKQFHGRPPGSSAPAKRNSDAAVSQLREELRKTQFENTKLREEVEKLAAGAGRSARGSAVSGGGGIGGSVVGHYLDEERDQMIEKIRKLQDAAAEAARAATTASDAAALAAKAAEAVSRVYA